MRFALPLIAAALALSGCGVADGSEAQANLRTVFGDRVWVEDGRIYVNCAWRNVDLVTDDGPRVCLPAERA